MLRVRLARRGCKGRPFYHIIIADARSPRDGLHIEKVGSFNPLLKKGNTGRLLLQEARVQYWLSRGAEMTDRVRRLLEEFTSQGSRKAPPL